ncbi:MAG: hypothetical protein WCJ03_03135 [Bacteroidales bacterium]
MTYEIEYEGGHPQWGSPCKAFIEIDKSGKCVKLNPRGFLNINKPLTIEKTNIVDVTFEKAGTRSAGKTVAGALIGGVLTGGVGLLLGGALGARKKNLSELYIHFNYNDRIFIIVLKTGKRTESIYSAINSLFV